MKRQVIIDYWVDKAQADLESAKELSRTLHQFFPEKNIFRIDHYLGKEPVQNILYTRFANPMFEPIWNRDHIRSIQITMAENFGVQDRGKFYDEVGALLDVVQNHMLQVVANLTIDPPTGEDYDAIRDRKAELSVQNGHALIKRPRASLVIFPLLSVQIIDDGTHFQDGDREGLRSLILRRSRLASTLFCAV